MGRRGRASSIGHLIAPPEVVIQESQVPEPVVSPSSGLGEGARREWEMGLPNLYAATGGAEAASLALRIVVFGHSSDSLGVADPAPRLVVRGKQSPSNAGHAYTEKMSSLLRRASH